MKRCSIIIIGAVFTVLSHLAGANQADDTTITITGHTAGATPFISKLTLAVSNTSVLKSIQFTIDPKPGSVTRPLSGTYSNDYLVRRGFEHPPEIILPVYGLYDGYANIVRLTYRFLDSSSKQAVTSITTATFDDPCGYKNPTILKPRTNSTDLSYDYIMVNGYCSNFSPGIIDSDGALRWVGTAGISILCGIFFDNAVYLGHSHRLSRIDLDGTVTELADYSSLGVIFFHHNIDRGKVGIILDASTTTYIGSTLIEVDVSGRVLKQWNMAHIISAAMSAGGDDPNQFVFPTPTDWFHLNGCYLQQSGRLLDRFKPGKFSHMPRLSNKRDQMDPRRSDETVVSISVFEEICAHGGARQPATDWSTLALDCLRSESVNL